MRFHGVMLSLAFSSLFLLSASAQDAPAVQPPAGFTPQAQGDSTPALSAPVPVSSFEDVMNRVIERERVFNQQIRQLHPLAETYIQNMKSAPKEKNGDESDAKLVSDQYFLVRLNLGGEGNERFEKREGGLQELSSKLNLVGNVKSLYSLHFLIPGFAQMTLVDEDFGSQYYNFTYVRREFLGEIRTFVIDVQPKKNAGRGRFVGRIWVEDQDYSIVRFNGTYTPGRAHSNEYLHFDSWRANLRPGMWLPAYIYSEEADDRARNGHALHFKAQTRLWGYDLQHQSGNSSFTEILVESPQSVQDRSLASQDATPVESQRLWEREAEDNTLERLQRIGLMAPEGTVDKVLQTVVDNLMLTNNLNIQPDVRCRVLLTTPLESFTIGHTIVISRGLLDVLPDEASLATVLGHELAHIVLGQALDTRLAFNDRMFFADEDAFNRLNFSHTPAEEDAADEKAVSLLSNSPYKDKLGNAGLFLRALQEEAADLKSLIRPHLGSGVSKGSDVRMASLLTSAPKLEVDKTDQIAALPLGGRIKVDPWTDRIEMVKSKPVALTSAREKMPFEITPFFPYLTRNSTGSQEKVALTGTGTGTGTATK